MELLDKYRDVEELERYYLEKINELESLIEIEEVIRIAESFNLRYVLLFAYDKKAELLYVNGEYIKAFMVYNDVLELSFNLNRDISPNTYNKIGKCKLASLEYEEALSYFEKAYGLAVCNNDIAIQKNTLYNIALNYKKLNRIDECLAIVEKYISLLDISTEFNDYIDGTILQANCYVAKEEFYKSIQLYESTLDLFKNEDDALLGYIYNNLGVISFQTNRVDDAIKYLEKAQRIRMKNALIDLPHTLIDKADVHFKIGDNEKALELTHEGIAVASSFHDMEYVLKGYYLLENYYGKNGNLVKLKDVYMKMLDVLNDKQEIIKVYSKLALIYIDNSEIEQSKKYLKRIVEL